MALKSFQFRTLSVCPHLKYNLETPDLFCCPFNKYSLRPLLVEICSIRTFQKWNKFVTCRLSTCTAVLLPSIIFDATFHKAVINFYHIHKLLIDKLHFWAVNLFN